VAQRPLRSCEHWGDALALIVLIGQHGMLEDGYINPGERDGHFLTTRGRIISVRGGRPAR
jgi:hypothetical protein